MKSLINFLFNKDWQQKVAISNIFYLYLKFNMIVEFIPLKYYYRNYLETIEYKNIISLQPYKNELSQVKKIGRLFPWESKCIVESLVIKSYLRKFGIDIPISLGVSLNKGFYAHAWCLPNRTTEYTEITHKNEK